MRHSRFHFVRVAHIAVGAALLVIASACASDTTTAPTITDADATQAVDVFTHLADSVSRAGGDAEIGGAYAALAEAVRQGGRISTIAVTVDGVSTPFLATALQTEIAVSPCGLVPNCLALGRLYVLRTLIAWQRSDPRRVIQLSSESDTDPIRAYLVPVLVPFVGNSASLTFFDGKGGMFFGTSGSQKFDVMKSGVACTAASADRPTIAIFPAPPRCTQADFTVTLNGKAEPSSFLAGRNTATGSHTFSMAAQAVLGARFELTAAAPPLPPIVVTPNLSMPAILTAKLDGVVTLTLTVSNPTSIPAQLTFNSGQHYDFAISDAKSGAPLWQWSADKLFMQMLSTETIPAHGSLVYTATWKPEQKGDYLATGSLVSLSHKAEAKASLTVP